MQESPSRAFLLKAQNPDGGWGYFPGKTSWLEPTGWAALALHGDPAADRAYGLVRDWQNRDGSCRPASGILITHWTASLVVMLAALRNDKLVVERGVRHLMETRGSESGPIMRALHYLAPQSHDREPRFEGWPWKPGAAAWIEPTVHGITALRMARRLSSDHRIDARIESAQNLIWHQRCRGGGWNYGARVAREVPLQPFPETTAIALIGLTGKRGLGDSLESARTLAWQSQGGLAWAWLTVAFRLHGLAVPKAASELGNDVMAAAIAEMGVETGCWRYLGGERA